jgi:hypothetical protein
VSAEVSKDQASVDDVLHSLYSRLLYEWV